MFQEAKIRASAQDALSQKAARRTHNQVYWWLLACHFSVAAEKRTNRKKTVRGKGTRPGFCVCHLLPLLWPTFVPKMHPRFTWTLGYKSQQAEAPGLHVNCLPHFWISFFIAWFISFTNKQQLNKTVSVFIWRQRYANKQKNMIRISRKKIEMKNAV